MNYRSTRSNHKQFNLSECILTGLAPDGGLFVPELIPEFKIPKGDLIDFSSFCKFALEPYFQNDELKDSLSEIVDEAFNFDLKIKSISPNRDLVELFHGPTAAFKDFGARFLASCLKRISTNHNIKLDILVATSGDTGGAVAAAFNEVENISVKILFPKGKVSLLQEQQLCCWGHNITSYRVRGDFDTCQALVKEAFGHEQIKKHHRLTSANSINIGRLLPQMAYHAYTAYRRFKLNGSKSNLIIPSGNLGNAFGAFWAKKMGIPIDRILISCNANQSLSDFFKFEKYSPRPSISTIANAMDVGAPSNFERLTHLFPNFKELSSFANAKSFTNQEIMEEISHTYNSTGEVLCPHTATASAYADLEFSQNEHCTIVATAHPSKFLECYPEEIRSKIALAQSLEAISEKEVHCIDINPSIENIFPSR